MGTEYSYDIEVEVDLGAYIEIPCRDYPVSEQFIKRIQEDVDNLFWDSMEYDCGEYDWVELDRTGDAVKVGVKNFLDTTHINLTDVYCAKYTIEGVEHDYDYYSPPSYEEDDYPEPIRVKFDNDWFLKEATQLVNKYISEGLLPEGTYVESCVDDEGVYDWSN